MEMQDSVTNATVVCRAGKKGDHVSVKEDHSCSGYSISGTGTMVGSCALECDIAYWEVILGKNPSKVRIGIKRYNPKKAVALNDHSIDQPLDKTKKDTHWLLDPEALGKDVVLKEGSIVGVHFDQSDFPMLSFTVDGKLHSNASVTRIRPTQDLIAAVSVEEGGTATVIFNEDGFKQKPWAGKFKAIVASTNLI